MAMSKLAKDQLKFVDPPTDEFNCPICLGILQEPYLTACCGNHFCEACVGKVKEGANKCPLCQETPLNGIINKSLRRKLNELKVYCMYKETGCKWIGDLGKLEQHLANGKSDGECQFVVVKCTISDLCKVKILRSSFNHHTNVCQYRQFKCKHCGYQSTYLIITTEHYNQCPDYPVLCPNNCSKQTYPQGQLDTHLASCPEQAVDCTFSEMGCKKKVKRQQLQQHLETNVLQHQMIMCTTIKQLQKDKQELEKQVGILGKESAMAVKESNWPLYLQKMSQISSFYVETPVVFEIPFTIARSEKCAMNRHHGTYCSAPTYHSPLFYHHSNGYKLQLVANFICHCSWCLAESLMNTVSSPTVWHTDGKICIVSVDLYIINGEYDTS